MEPTSGIDLVDDKVQITTPAKFSKEVTQLTLKPRMSLRIQEFPKI